MDTKKEIRKNGRIIKQKAGDLGLYKKALSESERLDFEAAMNMDGIDEEIALIRVGIKNMIPGGDVQKLKAVVSATNALARLLLTRHQLSGDKKKKLIDGINTVLRDVAMPLGVSDETKMIEK